MNLPKQETRPATSYRLIPLTQGQFAIVDVADFEWLNQWKWFAQWCPNTQSFYALRKERPAMPTKNWPAVWMHREILGLKRGDSRQGDHKESGSTLDNRRCNLRIATLSQQARNKRLYVNSESKTKGVSWHKRDKKWRARIRKDGKLMWLGYFATREAAYAAYCSAAKELHGEFAHLG